MEPSPKTGELGETASPGAFAAALDEAIAESGLSLDRLRYHLACQGIQVSRATLAYWRRGRSRPERATSLRAVEHLETLLRLPAGALVALLGPKAPRGRWSAQPPDAIERRRLWPAARPLCAQLEAPSDRQLSLWSVHDHLCVDAEGRERLLQVRLVAEALVDGVTRKLVYYQADESGGAGAEVVDARFCSVGRVLTDPASGLTVAELVLDHPLEAGEVSVLQYDLRIPPLARSDRYHRRFTRPVPQYVCQIRFDTALPALVRGYRQRGLTGPLHYTGELRASAHTVTLAASDVRPGIVGVRWGG